ncbi:MAG: hypothetical protein HY807_05065 [Nitrospirae bacterium]|nr:hypothetical protein [Nitrospirota bacterium]
MDIDMEQSEIAHRCKIPKQKDGRSATLRLVASRMLNQTELRLREFARKNRR